MQTPAIIEKPAALPATRQANADVIAFSAIIERVAQNPEIDIDKLNRLLDMYQAMKASDAERLYSEAMAACQSEMEPVRAACRNPQTNSMYADLAAIDLAIRPVYTKHGFCPSFDTEESPKTEHVRVVCKMRHAAGHTEISRIDMPIDGNGPKGTRVMTTTHAVGSGVTYGRRYLLGMVFNLAVTKDDDGNAAGGRRQQQQAAPEVHRQTPRFEDVVRPPTQAMHPKHRVTDDIHPHPEDIRDRQRRGPAPAGIYNEALARDAREAARNGREAFRVFCKNITKPQYEMLRPMFAELERIVEDVELEIPASLRRR